MKKNEFFSLFTYIVGKYALSDAAIHLPTPIGVCCNLQKCHNLESHKLMDLILNVIVSTNLVGLARINCCLKDILLFNMAAIKPYILLYILAIRLVVIIGGLYVRLLMPCDLLSVGVHSAV